jgi:hypothetical protein
MRATTSATLTPEAKVKANIGIAVCRLKAIFTNFIRGELDCFSPKSIKIKKSPFAQSRTDAL